MARSKIPVVDNSLTPDEQEFITNGSSDKSARFWEGGKTGADHRA